MRKMTKLLLIISLGIVCMSTQAAWQCRYYNPVKNQTWIGVAPGYYGARNNARMFCLNHTVNPANCLFRGCWRRW